MRFLPLQNDDRSLMMSDIGIKDVEELFLDIPSDIRSKAISSIDLPEGLSELKVANTLKSLSKQNISCDDYNSYLGAGANQHYIPALVNYIISRGEFLTSYTPYQPEVAQGTLQVLFEYQSQVAKIMGLDVANASLYDGASALAESIAMALRINKKKKVILSGNIHPYYLETTTTFIKHLGAEIEIVPFNPYEEEDLISKIDGNTCCVAVANPDFLGRVSSFNGLSEKCKENKALLIVTGSEPLALGLIKSPAEIGADIACYEGSGLCGKLNFGGPSLGLFATKKEYMRQMPGRVVGKTCDKNGKEGYVLTLSTREQHIRRDKATSNICSNAGLMATAFSIHMAMLGGVGFKNLAKLNHSKAVALYNGIKDAKNVKVLNKTFFNEFAIKLNGIKADELIEKMMEKKIFAGVTLNKFYKEHEDILLISVTECNKSKDIAKFITALLEV